MQRNRFVREWAAANALIIAVLAAGSMLSQAAFAQTLAGKWAATDRVMDNGEPHKMVLDLQQSGDKISGTLATNSNSIALNGTATGKHFELFSARDPKKPFLVGDLNGGELHLVIRDRDTVVAKPATAADEIPKVEYIEPPTSLHTVASNGLAKTPPMGWNSWNKFAGKIDDATVRAIADAMVSSGMRDAGYIYVNIDDTWQGVRDAQGVLQPNHKFPDMKALSDYVHSKGLKLGIYSSPGPRTCAGYPGSYGHEELDAKTWAGWGIDYVKYDWCSARTIYKESDLHAVYQKMGDALAASGRPMVFSLCEYGWGQVEKWGPEVGGNLWRTTGDIRDEWSSMIENVEKQVPTAPYAGPGRWNDPDMLEVGNGHMTDDEYRTHMSLWALVASPLLAGNDIRDMSSETKAILLNKEVIAIDQDALGKQASPVKSGDLETWIKPLADGSVAVGVVNLGSSSAAATVKARDLGLTGEVKTARDVWSHTDVSFKGNTYTATLPSHGALLLRVSAGK
ncbi:Alpha-galactosidase precursor [Acidisarcina polymorpha]|uniref:Alpha-galactosidase n=1 Tax=Acidisarcina polymorpha TaxID=2211140 RepID=A0A2Z5FXI0_9BACT|nr:glycoside hydrolase family 27 protein [Acidisarcina polymorpha]AXC11561.1 Alpha-galactosidase precursor [Acidisarcina polymorpha]